MFPCVTVWSRVQCTFFASYQFYQLITDRKFTRKCTNCMNVCVHLYIELHIEEVTLPQFVLLTRTWRVFLADCKASYLIWSAAITHQFDFRPILCPGGKWFMVGSICLKNSWYKYIHGPLMCHYMYCYANHRRLNIHSRFHCIFISSSVKYIVCVYINNSDKLKI